MNKDLVIVGGGSAGLAAAISAYDNGIKDILIIERNNELGGILNQCIHNGFGLHKFKEELSGPEYAYRYIEEVKKRNIEFTLNSYVLSISKDKEIVYSTYGDLKKINAKAIVFACGCNERTRGEISIPGDRPKGVFTAGLAQKYLNIDGYLVGKNVYILGSGDIGLIMARRMTLEGAKVIGVSELMPYSNGLNRNIVQCLNDYDIPLYLSNTVTKIIGKDKLEAIETMDVDKSLKPIEGTQKTIICDCLLLSVGLYPFNSILKNAGAKVNPLSKGAYVDQNLETSIEGVFSCGNVLHVHDLVDYVSEEGEIAGRSAATYLKNERKKKIKVIPVKPGSGIAYVMPPQISVYEDLDKVTFSFRVRKPIKKAKIIIQDGNNVISTNVKMDLLPSLMIKINLSKVDFKAINELMISAEEL